MNSPYLRFFTFLAFAFSGSVAQAEDLTHLSIADLIALDVTSASKKEEPVSKSAAAIYVLTNDDIRRSGATTIPELLRLVPGVHVGRIETNSWAVGIRGLNGRFSNKLLVLIDGVSIYNPLFAGVDWEQHDLILEDVARVEVIRGPGSTLWGSNAVNGVINIITKSSEETLGTYASAFSGNEELFTGMLRHGGELGDFSTYRIWGKYINRDDSKLSEFEQISGDARDSINGVRGGFRLDSAFDEENELTLAGGMFAQEYDEFTQIEPAVAPFFEPRSDGIEHLGGHIRAQWKHRISEESDLEFRTYYKRIEEDTQVLNFTRSSLDFEFQHRFSPIESQEVIWGLNYREYQLVDSDGSLFLNFDPPRRKTDLFAAFIQDDIEIVEDELHVILGLKVEDTATSGFEFMPNIRSVWTPTPKLTLWGAVTRSVRTPSIAEEDGELLEGIEQAGEIPAVFFLNGSREVDSEYLMSYEIGVRQQLLDNLYVDVATFYSVYDDIVNGFAADSSFFGPENPRQEVDLQIANKLEIDSFGGELSVDWRPVESWRLLGSASFQKLDVSGDELFRDAEAEVPTYQLGLRSQLNVSATTTFDFFFRAIDKVEVGRDLTKSKAYQELDLRFAWKPSSAWELALVGQNLLDEDHTEWVEPYFARASQKLERAGYVQLTWRH